MNLYTYDGPVMEFDHLVANHWSAQTYAPSEAKARSNLTYQYKKQFNKIPATRVTLPGKVTLVTRKEKVV